MKRMWSWTRSKMEARAPEAYVREWEYTDVKLKVAC